MNRILALAIAALALCLFVYGCLAATEKPLDPRNGEQPPPPPQDDEANFMQAGQNASIGAEMPPPPPS